MRKQLVISIAYQLQQKFKQNGENYEETYDWFFDISRKEGLSREEEFRIVLLAGTMKPVTQEPKPFPWVDLTQPNVVVADEAQHPVAPWHSQDASPDILFNDGIVADFKLGKAPQEGNCKAPQIATAKQKPTGAVSVPAKCLTDARKALGAYPYNEGSNYLVGDGYFSRSCIAKWGQKRWDMACEIVRREMKRG